LGLAPSVFWELTPFELNIMIEGFNRRQEDDARTLKLIMADVVAVPIINFCRRSRRGTSTRRLLGPGFFMNERDKAKRVSDAAEIRAAFANVPGFEDFKEPAPNG
jgi:hypothetical protein